MGRALQHPPGGVRGGFHIPAKKGEKGRKRIVGLATWIGGGREYMGGVSL